MALVGWICIKTLQGKGKSHCESPNAWLRYLSEMVMLAGDAWIKNQPREITGRPWLEAGFTMNEG